MKHNLIETKYIDNTYYTTIGTELGQFTGSVFCRPEDREMKSDYFGWTLAEIKAEIKYTKAKRREVLAKKEALTRFLREMSQTRTYDPNAFWVKKIKIEIGDLDCKQHNLAHRIDNLKDSYHKAVVDFDAMKTKIKAIIGETDG